MNFIRNCVTFENIPLSAHLLTFEADIQLFAISRYFVEASVTDICTE